MTIKYKSIYATNKILNRSNWCYENHGRVLPLAVTVMWDMGSISYDLIEETMPVAFLWTVTIQDIQKLKFQKSL